MDDFEKNLCVIGIAVCGSILFDYIKMLIEMS